MYLTYWKTSSTTAILCFQKTSKGGALSWSYKRQGAATYLGGRLYPVLGGHLWVDEAIVLVPHVVLEGRSSIRKIVGLLHISQECLLRIPATHTHAL